MANRKSEVEFDASRYERCPKGPLLTTWGLEALRHGVSEKEAYATIAKMRRKSSPEIARWMKAEFDRWRDAKGE